MPSCFPFVSHMDRRDGLLSLMRVCTWGTGEQEGKEGFVSSLGHY